MSEQPVIPIFQPGDAPWTTAAAPGSRSTITTDAGALRFEFALAGHGAWAIARRTVDVAMPSHYVVTLQVRGAAAPAELQVKLVDPSGANVWWWRRKDFAPQPATERIVLRRASLAFAWGPKSGGEPDRVGAIEIAVASDGDAAGTWSIESLAIEPRDDAPAEPCAVRASSCAAGHEPERALEDDAATSWEAAPGDAMPWIELDFGGLREWGGLVVDFAGDAAPAQSVYASADGAAWTPLAAASPSRVGATWLRTGPADARFVRLGLGAARGVRRVGVVPLALAESPAKWASARAREAPRGRFPRHLLGENAYWALVGGDGAGHQGVLGADGALELGLEGQSVEPFLWIDDALVTWADVESSASLADGSLPIPSVEWRANGVRLAITAFARNPADPDALVARYAIENTVDAARRVRLVLAVRPYQVTPTWQSLNLVGGIARIERIAIDGARIAIDAARTVAAVTAPDTAGASRSGHGAGLLASSAVPEATEAVDPLGFAEAAFAFDRTLAPRESASVWIAAPIANAAAALPSGLASDAASAWGEKQLADATSYWRARLARIPLALPPCAAAFEQSLRASVAWILVNREGPRIQPGARCYRRSWIRDGTLTGTAIAEMGFADEAKEFLRWYAPYQYPDGFVPCAVDANGIDRAIEHDSHGQLAWGVVELHRLTRDEAFLRELWPNVLGAVATIERLVATRSTDAFRDDVRFGLLPESISHEGYASNPAHSYWDDFFAVRGLSDAAWAAERLGDEANAARIEALRDALRRNLHASIARSMRQHGIEFVPGAAELGDFDPTSTAIAFDPCGEGERLPRAALEHGFERYWKELEGRWNGSIAWDAYTPYEIRNAIALLRIGWKQRALELLEWLIADQRIPAWREWPEVSTRDPRTARFLGDLPHGWVASSFVRTVRRLVVQEDEDAQSLVIAAGVPEAWVREEPGVLATSLPTLFGDLDLEIRAELEDRVAVRLGGPCFPPGGVEIHSPLAQPLREVVADGVSQAPTDATRARLASMPREVWLLY